MPRRPRPAAAVPRVRRAHARVQLGLERDALAEQPLVVLEREVGEPQRPAGADARAHLGDVGVDVLAPERLRDRHAVVAVADEVQVADPVDGDRRERLAAALRGGDPLPAAAHPRAWWGGSRGRSRACGRRCRRPSRAGSSAARAAISPTIPSASTTSSNGRISATSSGSRRSRRPSSARSCERRAREKSSCASALGKPVPPSTQGRLRRFGVDAERRPRPSRRS